jgi:hypothetical protein
MAGLLTRASKLMRARRFRQVIRLLEPEVFRYRQSFEYFYLLGVATLYAGDAAGAASYLERARALEERQEVLVGLAAIEMRRGRKEDCLKSWLEIVDRWPRNRQARRGLKLLRRGGEPGELSADKRLMRSLYPPLPVRVGPALATVAALLAAAVAVAAALRYLPAPARRDVPDLALPSTPLVSGSTAGAAYVMGEGEIRRTFERARRLLLAYRDNEAGVELNRLLLSNADSAVKERARMLKTYVRVPDFANLGRVWSWQEVAAEPGLYDGCYVLWRGRIANLRPDAPGAKFDFLAGYERGTELLGIVPASIGFAADLASGDNLEVIARLLVGPGNALRLEVTSLREIVPK